MLNLRAAIRLASAMGRQSMSRQLLQQQRQYSRLTAMCGALTHKVPSASSLYSTAPAAAVKEDMFCYQCEQTKLRKGCTQIGVCGKTPDVAALQDMLMHVVAGIGIYGHHARQEGVHVQPELIDFVNGAMFSTLTNVNFDADRFPLYIMQATGYREQMKAAYQTACKNKGTQAKTFSHGQATWLPPDNKSDVDTLVAEGRKVGVKSDLEEYGADLHGVRQLIIYGLKGMATYSRHARELGQTDEGIGDFTLECFNWLVDGPKEERLDAGANLGMALRVGEWNLKTMEILDKGHTTQFGTPEPTEVKTTPVPGKAILVSGHDMVELNEILKATEGTGINVYTHGEMLPAHSYPGLKKYKHLAGHFGGAWQMQKFEFPVFPGPIVVTTNCIIEPMKSYHDRLFTMHDVGWPGCRQIKFPDQAGELVEAAMKEEGYQEEDCVEQDKALTVGFGHDAILANAGTVIDAVKSGALKRIFVIGGCDGAENKRSYFSTLADSLPPETLILTLGCAKFRFNSHEFGTLGDSGIPRLLDMGQCNDTYGAVVVASALAKAFDTDVNSLPLSICLSWFEQKAVAVLLSLLHLGIQNIRIGPVLPAFLTPAVLNILVEKFNITPVDIRHPKDDLKIMMGDKE